MREEPAADPHCGAAFLRARRAALERVGQGTGIAAAFRRSTRAHARRGTTDGCCDHDCAADIACQEFPQLGPPPSLSYATDSDTHRSLLTDQDNQPGAASDPRVKQVPLQHGVMLGQDRDDNGGVLGTLRLVDGGRVGEHNLVQLTELIDDLPAVEIDQDLCFIRVDCSDEPDVAVEGVLLVVVLNLHHLVADAVGEPETLNDRLVLSLRIEGRLQIEIQRAGADAAAVHRAQNLHVTDCVEPETRWDAFGYDFHDLCGRVLRVGSLDKDEVG